MVADRHGPLAKTFVLQSYHIVYSEFKSGTDPRAGQRDQAVREEAECDCYACGIQTTKWQRLSVKMARKGILADQTCHFQNVLRIKKRKENRCFRDEVATDLRSIS
jgi:hypothetical protein